MQLINDLVKKEEKKDFSQMTDKELLKEVLAMTTILKKIVDLLPMNDFSLMTIIKGSKTIYNKVQEDPIFYKKIGVEVGELYEELKKRTKDEYINK